MLQNLSLDLRLLLPFVGLIGSLSLIVACVLPFATFFLA